jgi:hypothetical protein
MILCFDSQPIPTHHKIELHAEVSDNVVLVGPSAYRDTGSDKELVFPFIFA